MNKRKVLYILFIAILIVLANISVYYYLYFDNLRKNVKYTTELAFNQKSSVTYNIETNDNSFYNSKNLNDYDINKVNKIDVFYNYVLTLDKKVSGDYTYYVRGVIFDSDEEKKEIYKSEENKNEFDNKNVININNLTNIDLKNIINTNTDIASMINAHIKYELVVNYHVYNKELNKYISNSKTIEIDIPITSGEKIVASPSEEKGFKEYANVIDNNNNTNLVICMEFLGSIILYILCIAYLIERISPKARIDSEELEYILSSYKKFIIDINFLPDLSRMNVSFVENMDELVNYSKKYKVPIDYIEVIENKEYVFAVIYENDAYVYKVSVKRRK